MDLPDTANLIEDSIRLLDEAALTDAEFQADLEQLYDYQSQYESRPTFFRLMGLLERRGYFVTLPLEDHPDYEDHPEVFENLDAATVCPIFRRPGEKWSERDNPVVGYASGGTLYAEKGGELWERLGDEGLLEGEQAERPEPTSLFAAVADVVEAAGREEDDDLALRWYVALGFHLAYQADDPGKDQQYLAELVEDPDLERMHEVIAGIDDLEMKLAHPERSYEAPEPALRDAHPILNWWYRLL